MSAATRLPRFLGNVVIALVRAGSLASMLPSLTGDERHMISENVRVAASTTHMVSSTGEVAA